MSRPSIIVIGASSGGVDALRSLVSALPAKFPVPILIVLHVGAHPSELPALLNLTGSIPAKHAEDGEVISAGQIYVAPPDRHMTVTKRRLCLTRGAKENWARPAIDPLFRSAAEVHRSGAVGVILTGNMNDGTAGLVEIKKHGGIAIAQDPADATNPAMPASASAHVVLDHCVPLVEIPKLLVRLIDGKEDKVNAMPVSAFQSSEKAGEPTFDRALTVTCPECGGALRKSESGSIVTFGCHIGHSYTAEIMAVAQFENIERVMRSAVRCLNERADFCRQMALHDPSSLTASDWEAAGGQALRRAYQLRDFVEQDWIMPELSR